MPSHTHIISFCLFLYLLKVKWLFTMWFRQSILLHFSLAMCRAMLTTCVCVGGWVAWWPNTDTTKPFVLFIIITGVVMYITPYMHIICIFIHIHVYIEFFIFTFQCILYARLFASLFFASNTCISICSERYTQLLWYFSRWKLAGTENQNILPIGTVGNIFQRKSQREKKAGRQNRKVLISFSLLIVVFITFSYTHFILFLILLRFEKYNTRWLFIYTIQFRFICIAFRLCSPEMMRFFRHDVDAFSLRISA